MSGKRSPISNRVRHQQDDEQEIAVATLERDPAIEGLKVGQSHLRFDRDLRAGEPALRVPGSRIATAAERDLGLPERPAGSSR